jgi:hypothetical protein
MAKKSKFTAMIKGRAAKKAAARVPAVTPKKQKVRSY